MSKDINFKIIKDRVLKLLSRVGKHLSFIAVILILLVYIFTVWRISQLTATEPSIESQSSAEITSVPKVDQKAIDQIQSLEKNSPEVHSLFNEARNNPFGE